MGLDGASADEGSQAADHFHDLQSQAEMLHSCCEMPHNLLMHHMQVDVSSEDANFVPLLICSSTA